MVKILEQRLTCISAVATVLLIIKTFIVKERERANLVQGQYPFVCMPGGNYPL